MQYCYCCNIEVPSGQHDCILGSPFSCHLREESMVVHPTLDKMSIADKDTLIVQLEQLVGKMPEMISTSAKRANRIGELEAALRSVRDDLRSAHFGEGFQFNLRDIADRIAVALKGEPT